jgi:lipopolysaccharide exporter
MKKINKQMANGAIWMLLFKILDKTVGALSTFILVRLLLPEDFGLIAMSMAFLGMLSILVGFSFDTALIQNQNTTREHYDTVWTFHIMFGFFLGTLLAILAYPMSVFYQEPRIENLLYIIALSCPIEWSANIGTVAFRKDLDFRKEFLFNAIKRLTVFFFTVSLAYHLKSYWALAFGIIIGKTIGTLISYVAHPYRPKFCLSARHDLMNFSKWTFLNSMVGFIKTKSSDFIIGKLIGTQSLGIFTVANEIAGLVSSEVIAPINRVALSGYSKLNNQVEELRDTFLKIQSIITICATPAAIGVVAVADLFVNCLLGDKWFDTIPIIKIMAYQGIGEAFVSNSNVVCLALGKPKILTITISIFSVVLLISLMLLITDYGLIGAAYATLIATFITAPIILLTSLSLLKVSLISYLLWVWRPIASSFGMYHIVLFTKEFLPQYFFINNLTNLLISILMGIASYIIILLFLWILSRKPNTGEKVILNLISSKLRKAK